MKKFHLLAAVCCVTAIVSCEKNDKTNDDNGKTPGDEYPAIERTVRVKTMDDYTWTYDAQGRVASVVSPTDTREFSYSGNTLTITNNGSNEYTCTLNSDGFATQVKTVDHTIDITYDAHGYLTASVYDGVSRSDKTTTQFIEDGNILYWTRYDDANDFLRRKEAEYDLTKKNLGCVQTHWAEDLQLPRWMWESRLLGNTSVNVMTSCIWCNYGDEYAEKTAVYEYEYDSAGVITKEVKYYGVWDGSTLSGMDLDDQHSFTWESIN